VICVLESFFGKVSFSLDFDVERFGNVRHDKIDQTTDAENDVLINDSKQQHLVQALDILVD
jgi:hypothetical protein